MPADRIIDADSHFFEPEEMWNEYLDSRFRSAGPRRVLDNQGRPRRFIGGQLLPYQPRAPGKSPEKMRGSFEPGPRIADMDRAGIDVMVNYPSSGLYFFGVQDVAAQIALCQACERAGAEFVKTSTGYGFVKGKDGKYSYEGATEHDLALMRAHTSSKVQVKAAGGVRDLDALVKVRDLGTTRCGATATAAMLDEYRRRAAAGDAGGTGSGQVGGGGY